MDRPAYLDEIQRRLEIFPVVALVGSRQVGKTTLARQYCVTIGEFDFNSNFLDLENPADRARIQTPMLTLQGLTGLIVIDEIQHAPELFRVLRVLADRPEIPGRFLVLGSASGDLLRQTSESLAGRISVIEVAPLSLAEVGERDQFRLWMRGGYPRSFLAESEENSALWRESFMRTFLERDVPALGTGVSRSLLERLWYMLAHRHGQVMNASELGRSLGISHTSVQRYLDVLCDTFLARRLTPWYANLEKRQVKSPKVYLRDSGLLHSLLGISTRPGLERHPALGASWEGFAIEQVLHVKGINSNAAHFWAIHEGAEMDLVVETPGGLEGYEFKYGDAPSMTRSIGTAIQSLDLAKVTILYPGSKTYPVANRVTVEPLASLA